MQPVFSFDSYKELIQTYLDSQESTWGLKSRFCQAMEIHNAYLTQVLNGPKHLTLEQAERFGKLLAYSEAEMTYWLYLVQRNRAGTKDLEIFFDRRMAELRAAHLDVTNRLGKKEGLNETDQAVYYSSWHYGAIHIALLVDKLQTAKTISEYLKIDESKVHEVLEFLVSVNLVTRKGSKFQSTKNWVRLPKSSPLVVQHHNNLRIAAMNSAHLRRDEDLHYSGYFACSKKDVAVIQDLWLKTLKDAQKIIEPSPSEEVFGMCLDVFKLS